MIHAYSYFEKSCRKKCTPQSRKALLVVLSSLFFKEILKELVRKAVEMCLWVLKESNKRRFDRYSRQKQCIDHIPYYLSVLSCGHFSDNLSRNSCIVYIFVAAHISIRHRVNRHALKRHDETRAGGSHFCGMGFVLGPKPRWLWVSSVLLMFFARNMS